MAKNDIGNLKFVENMGFFMSNFLNRSEADFDRAELLAYETLIKSKIAYPPVVATEIAKRIGRKVEITRFKKEYRYEIAGLIDPDTGIIVVNADDPISRRNFTVAHEIGHIVMGHDVNVPGYGVLYRNSKKQKYKSPMEQEADCFAANLLVPTSTLREYLENYPGVPNLLLARLFEVSEEVIRWRRERI